MRTPDRHQRQPRHRVSELIRGEHIPNPEVPSTDFLDCYTATIQGRLGTYCDWGKGFKQSLLLAVTAPERLSALSTAEVSTETMQNDIASIQSNPHGEGRLNSYPATLTDLAELAAGFTLLDPERAKTLPTQQILEHRRGWVHDLFTRSPDWVAEQSTTAILSELLLDPSRRRLHLEQRHDQSCLDAAASFRNEPRRRLGALATWQVITGRGVQRWLTAADEAEIQRQLTAASMCRTTGGANFDSSFTDACASYALAGLFHSAEVRFPGVGSVEVTPSPSAESNSASAFPPRPSH